MVERPGGNLSVRRQCALLNLARSGVYRPKPVTGADDLALMRRIDEVASEVAVLRLAANGVRTQPGRSRGQPQARAAADARDGDRGAGSAPRHEQSRARPQDISLSAARREITEPNHVWAADITYIPMACGFLYLVAIIDWASRAVLAWRLSNTMDTGFLHRGAGGGAGAARQAADIQHRSGRAVHQRRLHRQARGAGIAISMDGRGRFMDNIFIERLWRSIKYEEVHLKAYADGREARVRHRILDDLLQSSPPSSGDEQPNADGGVARRHGQNRGGGEDCGYAASLGQRKRVAHIPTAETEAARSCLILKDKGRRDHTLTSIGQRNPLRGGRSRAHRRLTAETADTNISGRVGTSSRNGCFTTIPPSAAADQSRLNQYSEVAP
jgi:putative transposase